MKFDRLKALAAMSVVRPAVASKPYVQSLAHVLLTEGWATAYDEVMAITTPMGAELASLGCLVEGERLHAALAQFTAAELDAKTSEGGLTIRSGKASVRLGTLPKSDFLFTKPNPGAGDFAVTWSFVSGLVACLAAVGKDETFPAGLGVTLSTDGNAVCLYSTDNKTMTKYETDVNVIETWGKPAAILPARFCEQVVALSKTPRGSDMRFSMTRDVAVVRFADGTLVVARLQTDFDALDFEGRLRMLCPVESLVAEAVRIPDGFDAALARAMLVLGDTTDATVRVECMPGTMTLDASTTTGSSHDDLTLDDWQRDKPMRFMVDPALVARGAKQCDMLAPMPTALAMLGAKGRLTHLVSYVAK